MCLFQPMATAHAMNRTQRARTVMKRTSVTKENLAHTHARTHACNHVRVCACACVCVCVCVCEVYISIELLLYSKPE